VVVVSGNKRLAYGVTENDVNSFVSDNPCVAEFVGKLDVGNGRGSRYEYARILTMFFRWLKVVKHLEFSPRDLLDEHVKLRSSASLDDRRWAGALALGFTRDNPDLKDAADSYKYLMLMAVKGFFDYHEAPLTTRKNIYGVKKRRKFVPKQITLEYSKKILGLLSQRDRAISLIMLQSGQSINAVLERLNYQYDFVIEALEDRKSVV
jgi:hypothetical protein